MEVQLQDGWREQLLSEAKRRGISVEDLARDLIIAQLKEQKRQAIYQEMRAYAEENAGITDRDEALQEAALESLQEEP